MTVAFIRRGPCEDKDTKRMLCKNEGRDGSQTVASQEKLKIARKPLEARRDTRILPYRF